MGLVVVIGIILVGFAGAFLDLPLLPIVAGLLWLFVDWLCVRPYWKPTAKLALTATAASAAVIVGAAYAAWATRYPAQCLTIPNIVATSGDCR